MNDMSKQQSTTLAIAALVIVAGIVGYLVWQGSGTQVATAPNEAATTTPTPATPTPAPTPSTGGSKTGSQPAKSPEYEKALDTYANRFQFDKCMGIPGQMSVKRGTKVMLDNRNPEPHTYVVGSQTFTVAAYSYAIVTATDLGTYIITCDGGGSAQLNVEL